MKATDEFEINRINADNDKKIRFSFQLPQWIVARARKWGDQWRVYDTSYTVRIDIYPAKLLEGAQNLHHIDQMTFRPSLTANSTEFQ